MAGMPGMGPGGPGSEGGFGGGADDKGPANFDYPATAARAFLAAVRAKDRDKLAEAVALRSSQEASTERMKKLFASVLDQSISDEQLADIAKNLEGFQIVGMNDPKSTGRIGVILGKSNNQNGQFRRTLMLRKEAKGWKVADVGAQGEMEAQPNTRGRGTTTKRR
jgi:ketosteroid isomerase-like protein